MAKPGQSGLARVLSASRYSYQGLKAQWKHEAAFKQEVILFALMTPLAFWIGDNASETVILIAVLLIVLVVELLNSAVESVVDRIGEDYHKLSGRAKDQGSAAVFLSFFIAILVWGGFIISKIMG